MSSPTASRKGREIPPMLLRAGVAPPELFRRMLHGLAVALHRREDRSERAPWAAAGELLGAQLDGAVKLTPAFQRKLELRFAKELLAGPHNAEIWEEAAAAGRRRAERMR